MMKVLLIEDEERMRSIMKTYLEREGYEVAEAGDGREGLNRFKEGIYSIIILDVMLPEIDGWTVLREIRRLSQVPVIMVTARGEEMDRLFGFELGTDDYIIKPFSPRELVARVKAVARRNVDSANKDQKDMCSNVDICVDEGAREVKVSHKKVDLTPKEYDLLLYIMRRPNMVFTREQLLNEVWGYEFFGDLRTVDTHIKNLREKLGEARKHIGTVWGVGYKFEVDNK